MIRLSAIGLLFLFPPCELCSQTLVLWHSDGTTTDIELETMPMIMPVSDEIRIASRAFNMDYPKDDIVKFTFKDGKVINNLECSDGFGMENGWMVIHGLLSSSDVRLCRIDGVQVDTRIDKTGEDYRLSLNGLPAGTYVLYTKSRTCKIMKR